MTETLTDFYVRMFPYVAAARLRRARTLPDTPFEPRPATSPGAPLNRIGRQRKVSDPNYRAGVGVSTDTLYTSAWLDLAAEPLVLETPEFDGRYYSFQAAFADTSSESAFGLRTHGVDLPPIFLHGPRYDGPVPDDMIVVRSRTRYLNLPGRMAVDPDDPADMAAAHRLQDEVRLRTWEQFRAGTASPAPVPSQVPAPTPASDARTFLAEIAAILIEDGLTAEDRQWLEEMSLSPLEFGPGGVVLDESDVAVVEAAFAAGREQVDTKAGNLGLQIGGWTVNLRGPRFGADRLLRAGVARDQIYVTVPEEGVYPVGKTDADDRPLNGYRDYRIVFAADALPPVDAFWSVTVYGADGYLVENERGIHAVSSRRLVSRREDGAVEIVVGREPQRDDVMWLPSPPGEFYLMMRLFLPREAVRSGAWRPPPIERVS